MKEVIEVMQEGRCKLRRGSDSSLIEAEYGIGRLYTGKQRVFEGYQVSVRLGPKHLVGRSNSSLRDALRRVANECESAGFRLCVAGLVDGYSESGLSSNSGFGYVQGECIHMMTEWIECDGSDPSSLHG